MDTLKAMAMGEANRGKEMRVFDWDKAARIIFERNPRRASAGLQGDWDWTGGNIWSDGKPVDAKDTYTFLASTWALPELDCDGDVQPCFIMESEIPESWGVVDDPANYYWPGDTANIAMRK